MTNVFKIGLKRLNELEDKGIEINEGNWDLDDNEKHRDLLLLKGLEKLRAIGMLEHKDDSILGFRMIRTKSGKEVFRSFVNYVLKYMVATSTWNGSKDNVRLSYIFSIHDEAFAILTIMNNWKVWERMAKGEKRPRGNESLTLFTNKKQRYNSGVEVKIKGWSNEGLKEFNNILRYLITVRNKSDMKNLETELMEEEKEMLVDKTRKRKRENNDDQMIAEREIPLDAYNINFIQE